MTLPDFKPFPKIARLSREIIISEKIDGTNAQVCITEEGKVLAGSRTRWITPEDDNHGFARWVASNEEDLRKLGVGQHFGEWWGSGIQRGYGLKEKKFSLFNSYRWADPAVRPACCDVVPILATWVCDTSVIEDILDDLRKEGSKASPGFMNPEGIVIWHTSAQLYFKKTLDKDDEYKGKVKINTGEK